MESLIVKEMGKVPTVSESGFYRSPKPSSQKQRQQRLLVNIKDILNEHKDNQNYGVKRMMLALEQKGITASYSTVYRIMKKHGIDTISLFLALRAKKVYGVELVPEASADARRNAELNGITNVELSVGKAEEVIPDWNRKCAPDVIVVDPQRKGCDPTLLDTIIAMHPAASCTFPATPPPRPRPAHLGGRRLPHRQVEPESNDEDSKQISTTLLTIVRSSISILLC